MNDQPTTPASGTAAGLSVATGSEWQSAWPEEPGLWWFYGKRFGDGESRFFFVECFTSGNGLPTLIGNGHFWYRGENHQGVWQRVTLPALPNIADDARSPRHTNPPAGSALRCVWPLVRRGRPINNENIS